MGIYAESSGGTYVLKSKSDVEKLEELVSDFLYYGEGELSDSWDRIPFKYEEVDEEVYFSYEIATGNNELFGVSLKEVEKKMGIKIDINNVKESLKENEIDWNDFAIVCEDMLKFDEDHLLDMTKLKSFKKNLTQTEHILDKILYKEYIQNFENSREEYEEMTYFNSVNNEGKKVLNIEGLENREHSWQSTASELIGFENTKKKLILMKNEVAKIGESLKQTDLIKRNDHFALGTKEETLSKFEFEIIYDVKSKTFLSEKFPSEEDLRPIYEYFKDFEDEDGDEDDEALW